MCLLSKAASADVDHYDDDRQLKQALDTAEPSVAQSEPADDLWIRIVGHHLKVDTGLARHQNAEPENVRTVTIASVTIIGVLVNANAGSVTAR